jgi:NADH-quinone oxidoreductase subunit M
VLNIDLSIVLWLPVAGALLGALLPGAVSRVAAITGTLAAFAYSIVMIADYDQAAGGPAYVTDKAWISELGIHYKIGVDGLNLFLIALAGLLFTAAAIWALRQNYRRSKLFFFHMGLAHTAVLGALMAQDLALFVVFFDLMLVPFFFLTIAWGGPNRVAAMTKLFIYTLVGSLLMLTAAIATGVLASKGGAPLDFRLTALAQHPLSHGSQNWIFLFFAAAFLVKMPAFPVHGWMPDGYKAMPLPVLAVFSGVLSKVAAYGFLRVVLPLFPDASVHFQTLMLLVALASILYGSALAFTTTDIRLVLGYSSIAQLGFITLGIFSLQAQGAQGAILQAVNHGMVVAPAFFIVWMLAARAGGSEDLRDMGGIALRAPVLATLFLIVSFANLAMPGSSNFVGEFLILLGVFNEKIVIAIVAFTGVGMASVYMLRAFIRAMHNRTGPRVASHEMSVSDGVVLVPLVAVILFFAVYPQLALEKSERAVTGSIRAAARVAHPPAQPAAAAVPVAQPPQAVVP